MRIRSICCERMDGLEGIILKGIGGFYYIKTEDGLIYECKAKGIFRRENTKPLAGDKVKISSTGELQGVIDEIFPRKNEWLRPPLANLDQLVMVVSCCEPLPNLFNLDQLLTAAEAKGIEPLIVVTKVDLSAGEELEGIYRKAGFITISLNNMEVDSGKVLTPYLQGKITALAGNSGVGKSSLLNNLFGEYRFETSQISQKLGRGRHTTRHVELYPIDGGYVADTPGFSTIALHQYASIKKEELQHLFREFLPFLGDCRFQDCSHTAESGCAVKHAVEQGEIPLSRYHSYCQLYEEAKSMKEWENK